TDVTLLPPEKRKIGMVFQNYALYPHMKGKKNILTFFFFHKKTRDMELLKTEKFKKTSDLMGIDIEYLLDRKIAKLSGGEKQRIAIARCITRDPSIFLLDEPFSSLDAKLRSKYRIELRKLLSELKVTTVYVTHDQQEALFLADIIAVMDIGKITQVGTYDELYKNPSSVFVAEFLNPNPETPAVNLLDGGSLSPDLSGFKAGIRPEDIEILESDPAGSIRAEIRDVIQIPIRNISVITAGLNNDEITTTAPIGRKFETGSKVSLKFKNILLFDKATGMRVYK
ncbi:MAG: ABC transporter ATP-binding protein, partial [Smithella sp.]